MILGLAVCLAQPPGSQAARYRGFPALFLTIPRAGLLACGLPFPGPRQTPPSSHRPGSPTGPQRLRICPANSPAVIRRICHASDGWRLLLNSMFLPAINAGFTCPSQIPLREGPPVQSTRSERDAAERRFTRRSSVLQLGEENTRFRVLGQWQPDAVDHGTVCKCTPTANFRKTRLRRFRNLRPWLAFRDPAQQTASVQAIALVPLRQRPSALRNSKNLHCKQSEPHT